MQIEEANTRDFLIDFFHEDGDLLGKDLQFLVQPRWLVVESTAMSSEALVRDFFVIAACVLALLMQQFFPTVLLPNLIPVKSERKRRIFFVKNKIYHKIVHNIYIDVC